MTNMPYGCVESREVRSRAARHGVSPPIRLTSGGVARSVERVDRGLSARGNWCAGILICRDPCADARHVGSRRPLFRGELAMFHVSAANGYELPDNDFFSR
jgi:hypothetical protein